MSIKHTETYVNRPVGTDLVVSITKGRVRLISARTEPLVDLQQLPTGAPYYPGLLLSVDASKPYLKALKQGRRRLPVVRGKQVTCAMGEREGDTIELRNQWARVIITRERDDDGNDWQFRVSGDLADVYERQVVKQTAVEAMVYALQSLEAYEKGSPR